MSGGSQEVIAPRALRARIHQRRSDLIAAGLLVLIPIVLFADILFLGNTFFFRDLTAFYYPSKRVLRDVLLSGAVPYWNHSYAGGQPFAANPDYQVFYPLQWLILLPSYELGYHLSVLVHIPIALIGMYVLLRSIGLRVASALLGALSFGLSGFFLSYVNIVNFLSTLAWLPWVLFALRRFLLASGTRWFFAAAAFLGVELLAAEPTIILQTGLLMLAYACYRGHHAANPLTFRAFVRPVLQTAAVIAVAIAIASVQILPTLDLIPDTARFDHPPSLEDVGTWSMPPFRILELLYPQLLGSRIESGALRWVHGSYGGIGVYLLSLYIGFFMAIMVLAGAVLRRPRRAALAGLSLLGLVLAVGTYTPLLKLLYEAGVFRSIRYPEKFALLAIFPLIVLGSLTFERLLAGDRGVRKTAFFAAAALTICTSAGAAFSWSPRFAAWFVDLWQIPPSAPLEHFIMIARHEALMATVRALLATSLLAVTLRRSALPRWWSGGVLVFLIWDLGQHSNEVVERVSKEILSPPPVASSLPRGDYRILHESQLTMDHGGLSTPQAGNATYWFVRNALLARTPAAWGFRTVLDGDYDLTNLPETRALYEAVMRLRDRGVRETPDVYQAFSNVGAVVRFKKGSLLEYLQPQESQVPVVIEGTALHPRYYFADQIVLIRGFEDFVEKTIRRPWSPRVAFVEFNPFPPSPGTVISARERPNDTELEVISEGRGYLVISITPHRYWKAFIDGRPSPLIRTNVGYQGLVVPAGRHRIELRYRNPWVVAGGAISLGTIIALGGAALAGRRSTAIR